MLYYEQCESGSYFFSYVSIELLSIFDGSFFRRMLVYAIKIFLLSGVITVLLNMIVDNVNCKSAIKMIIGKGKLRK